MKNMTTTHSIASHHGNNRLRHISDLLLNIKNIQSRDTIITNIPLITSNFLIATCTEGLFAFTRENNYANILIFSSKFKCFT